MAPGGDSCSLAGHASASNPNQTHCFTRPDEQNQPLSVVGTLSVCPSRSLHSACTSESKSLFPVYSKPGHRILTKARFPLDVDSLATDEGSGVPLMVAHMLTPHVCLYATVCMCTLCVCVYFVCIYIVCVYIHWVYTLCV